MMKLMNKKLTKKGFTLAELLIVVAIIAILVAVSIPIFTSQLDKAKTATDDANVRAAKGAAVSMYLNDQLTTQVVYNYDAESGVIYTNTDVTGSSAVKKEATGINAYGQKEEGKIVQVTISANGASVSTDWVAGKTS